MSTPKIVDADQLDLDLTSVANAIRTKGGTSASLAFPSDFVSAIGAIPSGGGGGSSETLIGSGTYTCLSASTAETISVTYSGTPTKILVTKDNIDTTIGQMLAWIRIRDITQQEILDVFPTVNACKYRATNGTTAFAYNQSSGGFSTIALNDNNLTIRQYSNNYKVQPDTYHWYIWGVAE